VGVFIEKNRDLPLDKGIISFEERTILIQLESQTRAGIIDELNTIIENTSNSGEDSSAVLEICDSLKNKILTYPNLDPNFERSLPTTLN
jgi:hypothetical protein